MGSLIGFAFAYGAITIKGVAVNWADGENVFGIGFINIRAGAQEVSDVFRAKVLEIGGGLSGGIARAHQEHGMAQLVGGSLKMQRGVCIKAVLVSCAELQ